MPELEPVRPGGGLPPLPILYEDADVVVIDKPAGLLAVPDRWDKDIPNVMGILHGLIAAGHTQATRRGWTFLANAHRLDRDTSGAMVLAKNRAALSWLVRQFRDRLVGKLYVALVSGTPVDDAWTIDAPIKPDTKHPGLARVHGLGRPSRTDVKVVERFNGFAVVECTPHTGRLHQVRVHLKSAGYPVLCDADYGSPSPLYLSDLKRGYRVRQGEVERPLLARQGLHAASVGWEAAGGPWVEVQSPLPKDMAVTIKQLRKYAVA